MNLAPIVINEQTILGSRCGKFEDGLAMMQNFPDMPLEKMITVRYPLERWKRLFVCAQQKDALKILLDIAPR